MPLYVPPLNPPIPTGYSTSGGTPTKTLANGAPTTANVSNVVAQIITDLIARGVVSA